MSDVIPLNDPELNDLEQRLSAVVLPPTSHQRERLLYACGHAAGRAQVRRRLRVVSLATVMLTCLSAGLSFLLLIGSPPEVTVPESTQTPVVETALKDSGIDVHDREQQKSGQNRRWRLTVGTSFEQLLLFDRLRKTEPLNAAPSDLSSKRMLTAASRSWPDDLWD